MNSYNIFEEENYSTILYHAIARDATQVRELAEASDINLEGLTIDVEKFNVKDELGRPYSAKIEKAIVD